MPPKHWLWIAICNDSTVLTFHEEPDWSAVGPSPDGWSPSEWKRQHLSRMRDNMQSVLLQLSRRGYDKYAAKPLTQSSIRQALLEYQLGASPSPSPEKVAREGTSNLFFYLFEDYAAARPLKEAARTLEDLVRPPARSRMMKSRPQFLTITRRPWS